MRRAGTACLGCALSFAAGCGTALAQLSEREFLTDFPTVLSASRLRQSVADAPQAVTVIEQDTIRASGVREIAELFRLVPGFNVQYATNVKGLQPIVTYHGLGREFFSRLQVLVDGRSMNNATLGGIDWSDFPLVIDDIERVEVVRGPSTATHGVGAFLGTINFVTKHPAQQHGLYGSFSAGSDAIVDGVARYAAGADGADFRLTAGRRSDDGFSDVHDRRRLDLVTLRSDWQLGPIDSVMLQAGATRRDSNVGTGDPFEPTRSARFETGYAQLKWERSFDADNGFSAQVYYYRFSLVDRFLTDQVPELNGERFASDEGSTVHRTDVELQQTFSPAAELRCVWGGSVREDVARAPAIATQSERLRIWRLFGHLEWRAMRDVVLNAGAMLENNNLTGTDVAPQVALNYTVAPGHVLRFGVSKALRNPTLFEDQAQNIVVGPAGTPLLASASLQPETIVSTELGYVAEFPSVHTSADVKVFYDRLRNLIGLVAADTFPPTAFPRTVANGDDARQKGIEGQLTWRGGPGTAVILSAAHLVTDSPDRFANYSTSAPRNTVHVLWAQRFAPQWDGSVAYHAQSAYRSLGAADPQPGFGRLDLRLAARLPAAWGSGELSATVENALDRRYTEFGGTNVARRRTWLTLELRL